MEHVVLLGDSIFDNAAYVPPGEAVERQLAQLLVGDRVTLLARDGAVLADIPAQAAQLARLPAPPTWLIASCGGNDVLGLVGAMHSPVATVLEAAQLLAAWQGGFRRQYRQMLELVLAQGCPVAVATIYDAVPNLGEALRTALAPFNDVILREAVTRGLPVLDLRLVCNEADDYASLSPIEPSGQGGRKIAAAISELVRAVRAHGPGAAHTVVYGAAETSPGA
jgi:hypothetical protein